MGIDRIKRFLLGDPLSTEMSRHEKIPKWKALAVLSSDALSSVAYATEEILIPLAIFSTLAVNWALPIAGAIILLLIVVTISYRQTIDAYPTGGGAYTVAKENLGIKAGLVAGAALLIDYILTVAVSVAAGVENIASAFPELMSHKEALGISIIILITIFNLRGVKDSATIFALPTYLFIFSFLLMIIVGVVKLATGQAQPVPVHSDFNLMSVPIFLLLRAFASGCTALTGVEAISNGIPVFRDPAQSNAKKTMLWMSSILGFLFLSITLLAHYFHIIPGEGETAVSLLSKAIFGDTFLYYVVQFTTALILILAANTSYADFPRLSSLLANDRFLPRQLASLGDRLVFSNGVFGLSLASIILIILFKGDTHHLIPLYAVGVFLSFTLSQAGMVIHHIKTKHPGWIKSLVFNALGALTTLTVLIVIGVTKFIHGAWMVILLIPILVIFFQKIRDHYEDVAKKLRIQSESIDLRPIEALRHHVIVPVAGIHPGVINAVRYAISISSDVQACSVEAGVTSAENMQKMWQEKFPNIPLRMLKSPYRSVIKPILDFIDQVEKQNPGEMITVVIPEFVITKWYHQFLHNQTAFVLYAYLRFKKNIYVTTVRHHIE